MIGEEYDRYDAIGLAGLIAKKELNPSELIETTINRIESLNPKLNAIIARCFDSARDSITQGLPAGSLTGVPYLVRLFCF